MHICIQYMDSLENVEVPLTLRPNWIWKNGNYDLWKWYCFFQLPSVLLNIFEFVFYTKEL